MGTVRDGISLAAITAKAVSQAAWPDGNEEVGGRMRFPAPGGRSRPNIGFNTRLATTPAAP